MADSTIFFHNADKTVRKEISTREVNYGTARRAGQMDSATHNSFLASKTAWANVKVNDVTKLGFLRKGFESQYQGTLSDNGNIVPNPGLIDVNVRQDGDFGTLQRVTVNFKVFSRGQLDSIESDLLVVGQNVEVNYGWSARENEANTGKFTGVTNNFGYTLNKEGGFDCTFDAVGEGYFTLGVNPVTMAQEVSLDKTDASELPAQDYTGIVQKIAQLIDQNESTLKTHNSTNGDGLASFELFLTSVASGDEKGETNGDKNSKIQYYITLEKLIKLINDDLSKSDTKVTFVCDTKTTCGHDNPFIKSAAINHIIFPGERQGNYSEAEIGALLRSIPFLTSGDVLNTFKENIKKALEDGKLSSVHRGNPGHDGGRAGGDGGTANPEVTTWEHS